MIRGLVLSVGMPRAGSGWHFNLIHDLIVAGGGQDARRIREQYRLQRLLTEVNCNISTLKFYRLLPVLLPSLLGNTYSVKTHAGPSSTARWLVRGKRLIPTYVYRDPRAALLSAYEIGQRAAEKGRANAFSDLTTLERAASFIQQYVGVWEQWMGVDGVLAVRYEDLVNNYYEECERLVRFLDLSMDHEGVKAVTGKYRPEHGDSSQRGTHYSQGVAERFRRVLTAEQIEQFTSVFSGPLKQMGYPA